MVCVSDGGAAMTDRYEQAKEESRVSYCFDLYDLGVNYRISRARDKLNQLALLWQFGRFALGPAGDTPEEAEAEAQALADEEDEGTVGQGALFRAASRVFRRVSAALAALAASAGAMAYHAALVCFNGPTWDARLSACSESDSTEREEGRHKPKRDGAIEFLLRFKDFLHKTSFDVEGDGGCNDESVGQSDAAADATQAKGRRTALFAQLQELLRATYSAMRDVPSGDGPRGTLDLSKPPSPVRVVVGAPRQALSRLLSRTESHLQLTKKTTQMVEERRRSEQALAQALEDGGRPARVYGWLRKLNSGQACCHYPAPAPSELMAVSCIPHARPPQHFTPPNRCGLGVEE